jgi:hypothetical protein
MLVIWTLYWFGILIILFSHPSVVDPIRLKMLSRITQWDPCGKISVKQNLENLLDLKLPQPEASQQEVNVVALLFSNCFNTIAIHA